MKPTKNYGLSDSLIDAVRKSVEEALVGGQKKLDVDKDGKLEKSDFASLRAKKDVVTIKPKLKEEEQIDELSRGTLKSYVKKANKSAQHYSFEPAVRDPESGNQYRPTYTKRSKGIDLAKDKLKREEVEQMDETVKNFDVHPKHARKIAQHLNNVGIRTKTSANDDRGLANDDPGSVNITATHKDPAHLAIHISKAVDAHARDHALSARMRGQLRASGVEPKLKREEVEQMDEIKLADLPRRMVKGTSYGANYVDPEGADETAADMKKPEPKRKSGPQGTMKRRFNTKSYTKLRSQYK